MTTYPNLPQRRPVASRLFAVVSLLLALCLVPVLSAQENPGKKAYDIPADDAERALKTFAHQSGLEVLFVTEATQGVRTLAVKGEYTPREALDQLLAGTPLTATQSGPTGAFKVRREKSVELAEKNVASRASRDRAADLDEKKEEVVKLDTFEVFGRKTLNMDIQRTRDDPQPYVVFDRKKIEQVGAGNLHDFFKNALSMNASQSSPTQRAGSGGNAHSQINLRGLGANQTLILVDGRRMPSRVDAGGPNQPDVFGIPMASIERIEVLPSTASGIYGGGATGGVINIIMRRGYNGAEISLTYDNTFDTDTAIRRFDLSWGTTLENGKTSVMLTAAYSDQNDLFVQDRDLLQRARRFVAANLGTVERFRQNNFLPSGATPNIFGPSNVNLTLKGSNQSLGSSVASVPYGYRGPAFDGGLAFLQTSGALNSDLPLSAQSSNNFATDVGAFTSLVTAPTNKSLSASIQRDFNSRINAFIEVSHNETEGHFTTVASPATIPIAANALGNPFNQPILISLPMPSAVQVASTTNIAERIAGGIILKLPVDWSLGIDYTYSRSKFEPTAMASLNSTLLRSSIASGALNVFSDPSLVRIDYTPYFLPKGTYSSRKITQGDLICRISGPVKHLGFFNSVASIAIAFEKRGERTSDYRIVLPQPDPAATIRSLFPSTSQYVDSAYTELRWKLFQQKNLPLNLSSIELQMAARYDSYDTNGATSSVSLDEKFTPLIPVYRRSNTFASVNPTIALKYSPLVGLMLRSSHGTGFIAPSAAQLVPGAPIGPFTFPLTDPLRNNETVGPVTIISGGNSNLRPEESTSTSAGIAFEPRLVNGLYVSADYTQIRKTDNIDNLSGTRQPGLLSLMQYFPDRIDRGAPTNGFAVGPIKSIDNTLLNIARFDVEALDFALNYRFLIGGMGELELGANATYLISITSQ